MSCATLLMLPKRGTRRTRRQRGRVPVAQGELRFVERGVAPGQEVVAVAHGFSMLPLGRSRSVATLSLARSVDNRTPMPRVCGRADVGTGSRVRSMGSRTQHISIGIDRPAGEVYDFAADPLNLPMWAAGLAGSRVEHDGEHWFTESPMGRVTITFAPRNDFGVLDHDVTVPSGETVYNPLRVIRDGDGCEVVFTIRQRPDR